MNVLVTGGAGFIGSVVVSHLVKAGHKVVVYDNLSTGNQAAVTKPATLVRGELNDATKLESVFRENGFDAVMHFAASIEAGESMRVPEKFFANNTAATLVLLQTMIAHGANRLVFSSTAALYGEPRRVPIQEDDTLDPTNAYGESKLLVERMLVWLHKIHGFRYASLRYFNVAGATAELGEAHDPESHLIPLVLQVAQGKRPSVSIYGNDHPTPDGTCIRDYIHVSDLADAHLLALNALGERAPLIYNLGNGQGFSVRQVIEAARRVTGHAIPAVDAPRRAGDPAVLVASSAKITRELGWKPKFPELETIVESAWQWMQNHPKGYGDRR